MKAVLYARVSSERQDTELSISAQLKALREQAQQKGYEVVHEFIDEAESGRSDKRPQFQEMISLARRKPAPFQCILVWKLSRFARNREDSIIYKSLLRRQGVQVISLQEPVENSPTGKMLEGMIEVLDEFYSSNLAQDVVRGMREAASRGYWVSPVAPFGYRKVVAPENGKPRVRLEIEPNAAAVVRRIFEMNEDGEGVKEIGKALNAEGTPSPRGKRWGKSTVYATLTNETYVGTLVWGTKGTYHLAAGMAPIKVPNAFPGLVSERIFKATQERLHARAPKVTAPRRLSSPYLLSGLLHCGSCGATMTGAGAKSGKFHYYLCTTAARSGKAQCAEQAVPQKLIERLVLDNVRDLILQEKHITELVRLTNEELAGALGQLKERLAFLDTQEADVDRRLGRLYDALETGTVSTADLAPRIQEHRIQRDLLERAKAEAREALQGGTVELIDRKQVLARLSDIRALIAQGTLQEQRTILKSFIREIVKKGREATIRYTLPLAPGTVTTEPRGVLTSVQSGGPRWSRTIRAIVAGCWTEILAQPVRVYGPKNLDLHVPNVALPNCARFLVGAARADD